MKLVRNGLNPVKLPFALKTNHPVLASWANEVRTCLQQLRDRIPTVGGGIASGGGAGSHPFKLRVSEGDLSVDYGMVYVSRVYPDTASKPFLALDSAVIAVGAANMRNDPAGGTTGVIALSNSTTYGVWIELSWSFPGAHDKTAGFSGDFVDWTLSSFTLSGSIVVSSTNTTPGSTSAIQAANALKSYIYIGKVVMDGSGVPTISQFLRSDIMTPGISLPSTIISSDAPNEIYSGTDAGLIVDP